MLSVYDMLRGIRQCTSLRGLRGEVPGLFAWWFQGGGGVVEEVGTVTRELHSCVSCARSSMTQSRGVVMYSVLTGVGSCSRLPIGEWHRMIHTNTGKDVHRMNDALCWRCGQTPVDIFLCGQCGTIQPPCQTVDAFAIFGLGKPHYDIDLGDLEMRYKNLQKSLHPDKFASASDRERVISSEQAMHVNHAYSTLKNSLSRAVYLLSLGQKDEGRAPKSVSMSPQYDEEKTTIGELPHQSNMLEAIMEFREEVEDASDEEELLQLKERVDAQIADCERVLSDSFRSGDITKATEHTHVLRYLVRMQEAVVERL